MSNGEGQNLDAIRMKGLEGRDIEVTPEIRRLLELKYLDAIVNSPGEKENKETREALKDVLSKEEKSELEDLENKLTDYGLTYPRLAIIMHREHEDIVTKIKDNVTKRVNKILIEKGIFNG